MAMDYASNFGPLVLTLQIALEPVRSVGTHSCDGTISAALIRARDYLLQRTSCRPAQVARIDIFGYGLVRDQFELVLPSGPAAPRPPDVPPEPPLESPGLRVEPGLVFSTVPLDPPLPEPLPAAAAFQRAIGWGVRLRARRRGQAPGATCNGAPAGRLTRGGRDRRVLCEGGSGSRHSRHSEQYVRELHHLFLEFYLLQRTIGV
jgi:hypothetical protein